MAWGVPKIGTSVIDATGNFDLVEPAGVAQGDLMVACIAMRGNAVVSLSGWTAAATQQNSGDTDTTDGIASGAMFYVVRGSSAPNLTVTRTGGDVAYAKIISYSGVSLTAPYDTGSAATQGSAGNTPTTATFNTALDNELIVAMVAYGDQYTVSAFDAATNPATASGATDTTTAPTSNTWIERFDANSNTGADTGIGIADGIKATAGATGTIQATVSSASGRNVMMAAAFNMEVSPTTTLSTPADTATISDSTPTLEFTGTDGNADSVRYNVQISNETPIDEGGDVTELDSYEPALTGINNTASGYGKGQSFTGNGELLNKSQMYFRKSTTETGTITGYLYAHTGTYGTSSEPADGASPLATSTNTIDISTLTTSFVLKDFNFDNSYTLGNGTQYIIAYKISSFTGTNCLVGGILSGGGHGGNYSATTNDGSTWSPTSSFDLAFHVHTMSISNVLLDKVSGTDSGFVNTTDGGDTDPFDSGDLASFTVQGGDALADDTYYWRVRAIDPAGSNTYGAWATTRSFTLATSSAAVTGTATASITETDIVTGGKTIIITLTGDTFIAAGTGPIGTTANTQALIDGITSAQAEGTGWNAVVRAGIETADVVRTSATVATITLDAEATYNITATETITVTVPAAVLTGAVQIVATPTFTVSPISLGVSGSLLMMGMGT